MITKTRLQFVMPIFYAWLIVLIARMIPIGGSWKNIDSITWLVIFIWLVFYFTAILVGNLHKSNPNLLTQQNNHLYSPWIIRLALISSIGAALIIYEFALIRKYGFFTPVSEIRIMEVIASQDGFGGSWISGIGRLMTPTLMVAWVLASLSWQYLKRRTIISLLIATMIVFYQQTMFEGGRFFLAALVTMVFISSRINKSKSKKKNIKRQIIFIFIILTVLIFFSSVFIDRFSDRDLFTAYSIWTSNFDLALNANTQTRLEGQSSTINISSMMLWAYLTQGINELNILLNNEGIQHSLGLTQFPQIGQALNKLGLNLNYNIFSSNIKIGTYKTLYGSSFIDFGNIGAMFFISYLGFLTGKASKRLTNKSVDGLSINAPLLITIGIFSPIVSLVVNLWPAFFWALFVGYSIKKNSISN